MLKDICEHRTFITDHYWSYWLGFLFGRLTVNNNQSIILTNQIPLW